MHTIFSARDIACESSEQAVVGQSFHFSGHETNQTSSSLRAMTVLSADFESTLNISKELLEELSAWQGKYVQQSSELEVESSCLGPAVTLGHRYIQMTIFRAITRPILNESSSLSSIVDEPSRTNHDVVMFARTGVKSATTAATTFIKTLQQEHFDLFWPQWSQVAFSSICFLELLMASSSPTTEEAISWFQDLHATRKVMRARSNMLPILRLGLLRIDALYWKRVEKVLHLRPDLIDALNVSQHENVT